MKYFYETQIDSFDHCANGRFVAGVGKFKKTLVDKIGRVYDFEYYSIKPRPEGFFIVQDSAFGLEKLIDQFGNVVCSDCREIGFFSDDGVAVIEKQDKSKRWITKQGEEFGEGFKDIGDFSGGYGCVQLEDDSWTYVDKNMKLVEYTFEGVHPFEYDSDYTWVKINGKCYVIDKQFNVQSGPYDGIMWIDENNIIVATKDKPKEDKNIYAYYKIDGRQIGDDYRMIHGFSNGMARVDTGKGYIYIDLEGNQIGDRTFKMASNFGEHMAVVGDFDENGEHTFTFLRKDGTLFSQWYPAIGDETEGLGSVMIGNRYYFIDVNEKIYGKGYRGLGLFYEGVAKVNSKKNKYKFVTRDLKPFEEEFDSASYFSEGFGIVKNDGVYDAINKNQLKLSEISKVAQEVEQNPKLVLNLPKEITKDIETTYLLEDHAVFVLENALQSPEYDDGQKTEFKNLISQVQSLMKKIEKDVPVYGPREFYML